MANHPKYNQLTNYSHFHTFQCLDILQLLMYSIWIHLAVPVRPTLQRITEVDNEIPHEIGHCTNIRNERFPRLLLVFPPDHKPTATPIYVVSSFFFLKKIMFKQGYFVTM